LRKALDYIDRNLDRTIRFADIAAECRVSAKTLQNAFRKYRDATPSEEIRERRLARADEPLRTTGLRIGDIAARVGYSSGSNLTRDYGKRFGAPPSRADAGGCGNGDPRAGDASAGRVTTPART